GDDARDPPFLEDPLVEVLRAGLLDQQPAVGRLDDHASPVTGRSGWLGGLGSSAVVGVGVRRRFPWARGTGLVPGLHDARVYTRTSPRPGCPSLGCSPPQAWVTIRRNAAARAGRAVRRTRSWRTTRTPGHEATGVAKATPRAPGGGPG